MIYVLAAIILTPITIVSFAKWFKRQVELVNPSCDNEGEIESYLADGLALALAKDAA
ncbi:hypothetical protein [Rhizobium leguminosarum]|uniref:hypothetical protein n=1 Tax=Rhizobium leguminosarum TaxID=384 RepID=UPI0016766567|nr:hypothetical protein [Rhizobium leguminosarum]